MEHKFVFERWIDIVGKRSFHAITMMITKTVASICEESKGCFCQSIHGFEMFVPFEYVNVLYITDSIGGMSIEEFVHSHFPKCEIVVRYSDEARKKTAIEIRAMV